MKAKFAVAAAIAAVWTGVVAMHGHAAEPSTPLAHAEHHFEFDLQAPHEAVFPLFGANGERAWGGPDWNPQFLYGDSVRDFAGAVFQVAHGQRRSTWMTTAFDSTTGQVQHVYFADSGLVTRIDIHVARLPGNATRVTVHYEYTALEPSANAAVHEMAEHAQHMRAHWSHAISVALNLPSRG
jgi:hypothetical protein